MHHHNNKRRTLKSKTQHLLIPDGAVKATASGAGAGDAAVFHSKFYEANLGKIWANFRKIWINLGKI